MSENSRSRQAIRELTRILVKATGIYGDIFQDIFKLASQLAGASAPKELQRASIDKRLNRLDEARDALSDTLTAVAELRDEIEESKQEHQHVLAELSRTLASKESADSKLESVRKLLEADKGTLREVTAPQNVIRQHTIGFFLGILASLVAAGIIFAAPFASEAFTAWNTTEVSSDPNAPNAVGSSIPQSLELETRGR